MVDRDPSKPLPGNVPANGPANMFGSTGQQYISTSANKPPSSTKDKFGVVVTFHHPVSVLRVRLLTRINGLWRTNGVCVYVDTTSLLVTINGKQQECTPKGKKRKPKSWLLADGWKVPTGPGGDGTLEWGAKSGIGVTGTKVFIDYPRSLNFRVEIADLKIDYRGRFFYAKLVLEVSDSCLYPLS